MFKKMLLIAASAIALSGCGTINNRFSPERLAGESVESKSMGTVVVSTGAHERCISFATFVTVYPMGSTQATEPIVMLGMDAFVHPSDFKSHHGLVNAFALPAGAYRFIPSMANPYFSGKTIPTFNFEVRANETSYVGELFMDRACGTNGAFSIRDSFERDWPMATAKNPKLLGREPVRRLMAPGEVIRK